MGDDEESIELNSEGDDDDEEEYDDDDSEDSMQVDTIQKIAKENHGKLSNHSNENYDPTTAMKIEKEPVKCSGDSTPINPTASEPSGNTSSTKKIKKRICPK